MLVDARPYQKLVCHAFCLQSCFCRINCNGGGCEGGTPQRILTAVYLWVGNLFGESKSWVYLLVQPWLWWGLDPLSGGRARKMGKVSSLCRPEISFKSPQITPPLGLTSDALANSAIRQPWTVVDSEFLGSVYGALLLIFWFGNKFYIFLLLNRITPP